MDTSWSHVRRQRIDVEAERLFADQANRSASIFFRVERFVVRCGRLVGGAAIAAVSIWIIAATPSVFSTSFAAQTLSSICLWLGGWWLGLFGLMWAFSVALGEGPKELTPNEILGLAEANVDRRFPPPLSDDEYQEHNTPAQTRGSK
ncbi:MAG TPA: hypothetical protein VLJ58_09025 [Ramlibacter sp.]|nr:hypothetical protein [Ramlibacter sp.]